MSKMTPKLSQKSKVRIKGTLENKSCSITWVDPKTVFDPHTEPKNSQEQTLYALYEYMTPTLKISYFFAPKSQKELPLN